MVALHILVVEDDPDVCREVGDALRSSGHAVTQAADGAEAIDRLASTVFDIVVTDVRLPKENGLVVFERARRESPTTEVILMTSFGEVKDAVHAVKHGAFDYLTKPFELDALEERVRAIEERITVRRELEAARAVPVSSDTTSSDATRELLGASPAMARVRERLARVAASDTPALLVGESGTGKDLAARALHAMSPRRSGPFEPVTVAALPAASFEHELASRFNAAKGGTIVLDAIGDLDAHAQAKLLSVLDGARAHADVRIVSATRRDLKRRIVEGQFREDVYYRLNGVTVGIPPLRDRAGDLPMLLHHFFRRFIPAEQSIPEVTVRAWGALSSYAFPGNVRELLHTVEQAVVLARGGAIDLEHLPPDLVASHPGVAKELDVKPLNAAIRRFERDYLIRALASSGGRRTKAAELLGISRKNLWEKLRAHGISDADFDD